MKNYIADTQISVLLLHQPAENLETIKVIIRQIRCFLAWLAWHS